MKNYKEYKSMMIGSSDYASLIAVGVGKEGLETKVVSMGFDGDYRAYIVDCDVIIGDHYELVAEFEAWLKIYDDTDLCVEFKGDTKIYRAGEFGLIIQVI